MNPDPRMNDPVYRDRYGVRKDEGIGAGVIFALVLGALIVGGGAYWAMNRNHPTTTATNPPAITTTGQGSPRTMAPVIDQVRPLPQTSLPQNAPAPATTTEPGIKQGVDAEALPATPKP